MADPRKLTAAYESWIGDRIPLNRSELERKHAEMRAHEYRFLRGSYHGWLARLAEETHELADAEHFYARLAEGAPADLPAAVKKTARAIAEAGWQPTWHEHTAGTGSLGHARVVGVGPAADGTPHAREAKQLGPGTAAWAAATWPDLSWPVSEPDLYEQVRTAIRGPGSAARVLDWHVRDLAPDVVRIEASGLGRHDSARLLRAMAKATADVHGSSGDSFRAALAEVERLGEHGFRDAVLTMAARTRHDF